jgi:predicted transcriptional regulator
MRHLDNREVGYYFLTTNLESSVSATSLKLPDQLKRKIVRIAASVGQTPHAFMVDALTREAGRAELRERFAADAAESERQTQATGKTYPLGATFDYLEARVAGRKVRRPKARAWRGSK